MIATAILVGALFIAVPVWAGAAALRDIADWCLGIEAEAERGEVG